MEIDIPEDLEDFVNEMLAQGEYKSESEIVTAGLLLLKAKLQQEGFPFDNPKEDL